MLTPRGRISCKVAPGFTFRKALLIENIARMELQLCSLSYIADALGVSPVRINQIKRTPEYLRTRASLRHGVISQLDQSMFQTQEYRQQYFNALMPSALRILAERMLDKPSTTHGQAVQAKVALEFLDREGTFAKVSRTEIKAEVKHNYGEADEVSRKIREAVGGMVESKVDPKNFIHTTSAADALTPTQQDEALSMLESLKPETEVVQ